jgi:hypothetical protein
MTELNICPEDIPICITRGDTVPWTFTIKSNGVVVDITGYTFLLTVDPSEEPTTSANNLFQLSGTIVNGPAGLVRFAMTTGQANQTPGVYYYDLQMTDGSGAIRTIAEGEFEFEQDVTK